MTGTWNTFRIQQGSSLEGGLGKKFALPPLQIDPSSFALIHVDHRMRDGVRLKPNFDPLYGGFVTDDESEFLVESKDDTLVLLHRGDVITIFAFDGSVQTITFTEDAPVVHTLAPQEAMNKRLERIDARLGELQYQDLEPDNLIRAEDKLLHEIPLMLKMMSRNLPMRARVMTFVEHMTRYVELRAGVRKHFKKVLEELGDTTIYGWLVGGRTDAPSADIIQLFPKAKHSGPLVKVSQKKQARSAEDAKLRAAMRGPTGGGAQVHSSEKQKKTGKK